MRGEIFAHQIADIGVKPSGSRSAKTGSQAEAQRGLGVAKKLFKRCRDDFACPATVGSADRFDRSGVGLPHGASAAKSQIQPHRRREQRIGSQRQGDDVWSLAARRGQVIGERGTGRPRPGPWGHKATARQHASKPPHRSPVLARDTAPPGRQA